MNQKSTSSLDKRIMAASVCILLASSLASAAPLYWGVSLLAHPRPQYLIVALLCFIYLQLRKQPFAYIALAAVILNSLQIAPLFFGQTTPIQNAQTLTISHINLDKDKTAALDYLANRSDDILFLQEVTPVLAGALTTRLPDHRLILAEPLWNTHGSAMLVHNDWRGEVVSAEIIHIPAGADRPLLTAEITLEGQLLTLLSLHTTRPTGNHVYLGQLAEFEALANWASAQITSGKRLLIIGDFNTTPWAANYRQLLRNGDLQNGMRGHGAQFSWPGNLPLPLRIPIDLAIHSNNVVIDTLTTGDYVGSDHLPLHLKIALK